MGAASPHSGPRLMPGARQGQVSPGCEDPGVRQAPPPPPPQCPGGPPWVRGACPGQQNACGSAQGVVAALPSPWACEGTLAIQGHQPCWQTVDGGSRVPSLPSGPRPQPSCSRVGVAWPGCHLPAPWPPPTLAWYCPPLSLDLLRKAQWSWPKGLTRPHSGTLVPWALGPWGRGLASPGLVHTRQVLMTRLRPHCGDPAPCLRPLPPTPGTGSGWGPQLQPCRSAATSCHSFQTGTWPDDRSNYRSGLPGDPRLGVTTVSRAPFPLGRVVGSGPRPTRLHWAPTGERALLGWVGTTGCQERV